jgi:O-antigen ligase
MDYIILHPSRWLTCDLNSNIRGNSWFKLTEENLRPTGVGRLAAIAAIATLSGLWTKKWRTVSGVILILALILLLTSGARTSFVAFGVAGSLVLLLHGGKKAVLVGLLGATLLLPFFWATGISETFLDNCFWRTSTSTNSSHSTGLTEPIPDKIGSTEPIPVIGTVSTRFFNFSGRTGVWRESLNQWKDSPLFGYGFQADRLILGTHMHNALLHALYQTGAIGALAFLAAAIFAWLLAINTARKLDILPPAHKSLAIQSIGLLAFFSVRSFTESSGAFFGIDWLLLAPVLLYLQVISQRVSQKEAV